MLMDNVQRFTAPDANEEAGIQWQIETAPVAYDRALAFMEARARTIRERGHDEMVWLLEHPPVYTAGTGAELKDLINPKFPVYHTGRGGKFTYHGPGQRIGYVMLDLQKRGPDLKRFVFDLEEWIIRSLFKFNVLGQRREGRVGIWVDMEPYGHPKGTEAKIAAIGVRVKKWVTFHGVSININPELGHYDGIVPCGISEYGITSLEQLGRNVTRDEFDTAMQESWYEIFT